MATYIDSILAVSGTQMQDQSSTGHLYGIGMLGLRDDGLMSDIVSAEGNWVFPRFSRQGALHMSGIVYVPQGLGITSISSGDNNIGNVDVVTLPSIPAGTNNIGDVDVLTVPVDPFGLNADAGSATGSISAKLRFIAATGIPITSLPALSAGSNNIGDVDILSIAAGDNNIGNVDIVTVPADPFGLNADAGSATGSISAKLRFIAATGIPITSLPALAAGTNNIGDVDVLSLPALPAGSNNIGDVDVLTLPSIPTGTNSIGDIRSITTSIIPGTATTNLGKAAGGSAGATDVGISLLAARRDTLSNLTPTNGQYTWLSTNALGQLHISGHVGLVGSIPAGTEYTEGTGFGGNATGQAVLGRMDQVLSNQVGAGYADDDPVPMRFDVSGALWTKDYRLDGAIARLGTPYEGTPGTETGYFLRIGGKSTSNSLYQPLTIGVNQGVNVEIVGGSIPNEIDGALENVADVLTPPVSYLLGTDLWKVGGLDLKVTALAGGGDPVAAPSVIGGLVHDTAATGSVNIPPLLIGGYASAAAPTDVSTDGDATRAWFLRNGAQAVVLTAGGTLITGDGSGLDVDTELPAAATIAADGVAPTVPGLASYGFLKTPGAATWDRVYSVVNAANTTGTGITAAGIMGHYDDTSTQTITENQFGNLRMSLSGVLYTGGSIQHDFPDAGNPNKMGMRAINHKVAPVEVSVNDVTNWYANRSGVPFVIGGHPDIITSGMYTTAVQTNLALLSYPANYKIVVTEIEAMCDKANTVDVGVYAGFHSTTTPVGLGQLFRHPGIAAGSGIVKGTGAGILGIGASGDKLLVTSEVPTTGGLNVAFSYYVINES